MLSSIYSLRFYILIYTSLIITIIAVIYSTYLLDFFSNGLKLSTSIPVIGIANKFAEIYQQNSTAQFPDNFVLHSVIGYDSLPNWVQAIFPNQFLPEQSFLSSFWQPESTTLFEQGQHYLQLKLHDGKMLFIYSHYKPLYTPNDS